MSSVSTFEDKEELFNLKSETTTSQDNYDPLMCFKSQDYIFLNDQNNGNYSSGQIQFDTLTLLNQFICYSDSYLRIPLRVISSGVAYSTDVLLAFKNSILDLITGMLVRSGDGQTLVNDPVSLHVINKIKRLLDTSLDGLKSCDELLFEPDTSRRVATAAGAWSAFAPASARLAVPIPAGATAIDAQNEGYSRRIQLFKQSASFSTPNMDIVVYLPLYYLHEFWSSLNFPICNTRFLITFYTPITNSGATPATNTTVNTPFLTGSAVVTPRASILDTVRLYVKRVTFDPETSKMVASKMASGFTKRIQYNCIDSYSMPTIVGDSGPCSVQDNITPSVVAPVRVWRIAPLRGSLDSNILAFNSIQPISSGNILVNNIPYYQSDLLTEEEFYDILRQNSLSKSKTNPTTAGLISFADWREFMRVYCFDVSRLGNRLADPSQPCSLFFRGQKEANLTAVAADVLYLVERSQVCDISFSNSSVQFRVTGSYL